MKRVLVLILIFASCINFSMGQSCGYSGNGLCSPNNSLTSFGITDYRTFPCVKDSVSYSEVLQVYFPTSIQEFGTTVTIQSVTIDSIVNLPCGLCWACNDSTLTYLGGGKACVLISGTSNEAHGTYQLGIYGHASTSLGVLSGNLDQLGFQFFMNVVGQNDTCGAVDIMNLHTACVGVLPNASCNFYFNLNSRGINNCSFDSVIISVDQTSTAYSAFFWSADNIDSFFTGQNRTGDSSSFTIYKRDADFSLFVADSSGCYKGVMLLNTPSSGPLAAPQICYATTDSSQPNSIVKFLFERDDYFHNVARYTLCRQDTPSQLSPLLLVGYSPSSVGYIIDSMPVSSGFNTYSIFAVTTCGDSVTLVDNNYVRSVLTVDTSLGLGYPHLSWTNSSPLNYDKIYVFSRGQSGHWRLRYASNNLSNLSWTDLQPDSTHVDYMLGYNIISSCDPSRSVTTAFSNFGKASVSSGNVYYDSTRTYIQTIADAGSENQILIYPNPAGDNLYLQTTFREGIEIRIYDIRGQLMLSKMSNDEEVHNIDIENLTSGIYFVNVGRNGTQSVIRKIIKK